MAREDAFQVEGAVVEAVSNVVYRVELPNGHRVTAHFAGKDRISPVSLLPGDRVMLEMSPYDLSQGRIIRNKR
jgi:translation initiation factor IF-1